MTQSVPRARGEGRGAASRRSGWPRPTDGKSTTGGGRHWLYYRQSRQRGEALEATSVLTPSGWPVRRLRRLMFLVVMLTSFAIVAGCSATGGGPAASRTGNAR